MIDPPPADRIIQNDIVSLSRLSAFLACRGQGSKFVVPFPLQGVGDQAIVRIDQHEPALCQIRFDLGALHSAAA